jgi:hypothetical protein
MRKYWVTLLTLVAGMMLGCVGKQPRQQATANPATLAKDSPCASGCVCQTIAFGAKACGGPQRYLIYSTAATDTARLAREVARYNEAERKRNRDEGRMSDCMMVLRPQVRCISGQCRAATAGVR